MKLLVVDPTYPEHEELYESFRIQLEAGIEECLDTPHKIIEVDAGPGASVPAWIIDVAVLGFAIFASAGLIEKNLKVWHSWFSSLTAWLKGRELEFSVDPSSASYLAAYRLLESLDWEYEKLEIISVVQHSFNFGSSASVVVNRDEPDEDNLHIQAVRQLDCRYVILASVDHTPYTLVIEKNGDCSYMRKL